MRKRSPNYMIKLHNPNKISEDYDLKTKRNRNIYTAWLFMEGRVGDDQQLKDIIELLGWKATSIRLNTSLKELIVHRLSSTRLLTKKWKKLIEKQLPYPDAIFLIGGRNAAIAHKIKKTSEKKIKLYSLGRPFAPFSWFDLIITTPQYSLPKSTNTIELPLPISTPKLKLNDPLEWRETLEQIEKVKICVLVGGNNSNYKFNKDFVKKMSKSLVDYANSINAVLLVTNSPRTPKKVTDQLKKELKQKHIFHDINNKGIENPYWKFIEVSQEILVTSDSISMISDACRKNKTVRIIALPQTIWDKLIQKTLKINFLKSNYLIKSCLNFMVKKGFWTPPRNIFNLHKKLLEKNMIGWFDGKDVPKKEKNNQDIHCYNNLLNRINQDIRK